MKLFLFKSIGAKIRFGYFFVIVLLLAVFSAVIIVSVFFNNKYSNALLSITKSNEIESTIENYSKSLTDQIIGDRKNMSKEYKRIKAEVENSLESLEKSIPKGNEEARSVLDSLQRLADTYFSKVGQFAASDTNMELTKIIEINNESKRIKDFIRDEIRKMVITQLTYSKKIVNEMDDQFDLVLLVVSVSIIIIILIAVGYSLLLSSSISKVIKHMVVEARKIAEGDLTGDLIRIKTNDELKLLADAFNNMKQGLKNLALKVHEVGVNVSSSAQSLNENIAKDFEVSSQISAALEEITAGTERQAREISKTAGAMETLYNSIQDIAGNSESVKALSADSKNVIVRGTQSIIEFIDQIEVINETMQNTAKALNGLNEKSMHIGKIIGVITGIAEQTNLLSLNAAIEAARAGDAGKGFAVVAEEVRKLADQSGVAAKQITSMIKSIQGETANISGNINKGVDQVKDAVHLVSAAHQALNSIDESNVSVDREINQISKGIHELLDSITSINTSSKEISHIADQLAAGSEEISASTEEQTNSLEQMMNTSKELAENAEQLDELIRNFKV